MPDARPAHMTQSLLNTPTPEFRGAAHSLYGDRGPVQASNTGRRPLSAAPESIENHVQDAIARVANLNPRQRLALRNELMRMTRDIGFIKCIHEQSLGPHSDAAAGVPMDQGRPL